jgi:hypothetical protein
MTDKAYWLGPDGVYGSDGGPMQRIDSGYGPPAIPQEVLDLQKFLDTLNNAVLEMMSIQPKLFKRCEVGWGMGSVVPHADALVRCDKLGPVRISNEAVGVIVNSKGESRYCCQWHLDLVRRGDAVGWKVHEPSAQ